MVGGHSYLIQRSYQVRKGYQKGWPPDYDTDNALAVRLYRAQVPRDSREAKTTLSHDSMLNLCFRVRLCPFSLLHLPHLLSTLRTKTWHWMPLYACLYTSSECQITFWCPADVCDAQQAGILCPWLCKAGQLCSVPPPQLRLPNNVQNVFLHKVSALATIPPSRIT